MAIAYLSMDDESKCYILIAVCVFNQIFLSALELQERWEKQEFVEKIVFFKEKTIDIQPEVNHEQFVAVKGLIFSIY